MLGVLPVGCVLAAFAALAPVPTPEPTVQSSLGRPPRVEVRVDNGVTSAAPGNKLAYRISVRSFEPTTSELVVRVQLPPGAAFRAADAGGILDGGRVVWRIVVPANTETTVNLALAVSPASPDVAGFSTVACVLAGDAAEPIGCASDLDAIHAHAKDPVRRRSMALSAVSVIVLAVLVAAAVMVVYRRRARRSAAS